MVQAREHPNACPRFGTERGLPTLEVLRGDLKVAIALQQSVGFFTLLFASELARHLNGSGITTNGLHPGVVASDIWRKVPWPVRPLIKLGMSSPEEGAATTLYCALSPEAGAQSGLYYDSGRISTPSRLGRDAALAAELWQRSAEWVGD
jgi:NAD(P)-dependent dehydrogenase (short-subunit alcohol dehydrogenase family)